MDPAKRIHQFGVGILEKVYTLQLLFPVMYPIVIVCMKYKHQRSSLSVSWPGARMVQLMGSGLVPLRT